MPGTCYPLKLSAQAGDHTSVVTGQPQGELDRGGAPASATRASSKPCHWPPISARSQGDTGSQCILILVRNAYHVRSGAAQTFRTHSKHSAPTQQVMCSPFGPTVVHLPRLLHRSGTRLGTAAAAVTVQAQDVITGYPAVNPGQSRHQPAQTCPATLDFGCRTRAVGESTRGRGGKY
jgi:hypothetical protein